MQVNKLEARRGLRWVGDGFRLFKLAPLPLLVITMTYLLLLVFSSAIPLLGSIAPAVLAPMLSVGMMSAVRAADEKRPVVPSLLFSGLRERGGQAWRPLLMLGLIGSASMGIALMGSAAINDQLFQILSGSVKTDDVEIGDQSLRWAGLVFLAIYLPAQMALWYAPVFVAWDGIPIGKALFFSFAAVVRNKGAFALYLLGWLGTVVAIGLVLSLLSLLLNGASLLYFLQVPISLTILTTIYCSFWATYRDTIH
ncbi:MAG: BPSS1780 family membrane protein [Burkholderiaceae bacterium]